MLIFNRGLHCPICRSQLSEMQRRLEDFSERGVELVSVSGESAERAEQMRSEWEIDAIPIVHDLSEKGMREWGLFVSRGIKDGEPDLFNEPALFLIKPDGTVYYESILSMPVGRPPVDDLLDGIDFFTENDYPAPRRGLRGARHRARTCAGSSRSGIGFDPRLGSGARG